MYLAMNDLLKTKKSMGVYEFWAKIKLNEMIWYKPKVDGKGAS